MHSIKIYFELMKMSIKGRLQFPFTFILDTITHSLLFFADFLIIYFFAIKIGSIHAWSPEELIIMYLFTILASGLDNFFTNGLRGFEYEILSGNFDTKMIRPIHPLLMLMGRVNAGALSTVLYGLVIWVFIVIKVPEYWNLYTLFLFFISVIGGTLIFSSMKIASSAMAYWIYDSESFYKITKVGTRQLLWYPLDIYGRFVKIILITVLPLAFIGFMPTHIITGKVLEGMPAFIAYLSLPVGVVFFTASILFWNRGLKRYEGSGA